VPYVTPRPRHPPTASASRRCSTPTTRPCCASPAAAADPATAEDVAAETFATGWRRLDRVPADPRPWLFVVARNELASRRRAAVSDRHKVEQAGAVAVTRGRDAADAFTGRDAVVRAFNSLTEPDREALRLVAWDGLSLADAARVAGTSRAAFAMRVSRARRRLAAAVDDLERGPLPHAPRPLECSP
jgi:RNA polymerase sigma-70 factor (ECF subfamily)